MAPLDNTHETSEQPRRSDLLHVAFLGPEGTYSHQVAFDRFHESVIYVKKGTIADTFNAVPSETSLSLLPKENSIFGPVTETYDLLRSPEVGRKKFIREEITLQVQHCLLVAQGMSLQNIKRVLSHEQALGQCSNFLSTQLPEVDHVKMPSTAAAAEAILADDMRADSAAICSQVCTSVYRGLIPLYKGIQNEPNNFTKFWIICDSPTRSIPGLIPSVEPTHAVVRVSPSPSSNPPDLAALIAEFGLVVIRMDRRPSLQAIPFHDVYFLDVQQDCSPASVDGKLRPNAVVNDQGERRWKREVDDAIKRVRDLGWDACALGVW